MWPTDYVYLSTPFIELCVYRASVKVKIPVTSSTDLWRIGWVQACSHMINMIVYDGYGVSSYEFPNHKPGKTNLSAINNFTKLFSELSWYC